jgi:uncharacterized protein YoxC
MFDIFSFPNITGESTEEKVAQIYNYLLQLKEELEFTLTSISVDNLSTELVNKLNELGSDIQKSNQEREDQVQQVVANSISVSDVLNSAQFKAEIQSVKDEATKGVVGSEEFKEEMENARDNMLGAIEFTVNFSTGNLEYTS